MEVKSSNILIPDKVIFSKILIVRNKQVILDKDLAVFYQVETKQLKRAVRRNIDQFPDDFMFELTLEEFQYLRSQFGTSSWGGSRYVPMAFSELWNCNASQCTAKPKSYSCKYSDSTCIPENEGNSQLSKHNTISIKKS